MKRKAKILKISFSEPVIDVKEFIEKETDYKKEDRQERREIEKSHFFFPPPIFPPSPLILSPPSPPVCSSILTYPGLAPIYRSGKKKALIYSLEKEGANAAPHGIWSDMRGERRFLSSIALLLKEFDWDVDVVCGPAGRIVDSYEYKQCGINCIYEKREYVYDLCIGWIDSLFGPNKYTYAYAKNFLFCTWVPNTEAVEILNSYGEISNSSLIINPNYTNIEGAKALPFMFVDKFEKSKFKNKTLVWTARGFGRWFYPDGGVIGSIADEIIWYLEAILKAAREGYNVIFLCHHRDGLYSKRISTNHNGLIFEKIMRELEQKPNVKFYESLPQDQFIEIMKRGSIVVRPGPTGGSFIPALMYGLVPTLTIPWQYPYVIKKKEIPGVKFYEKLTQKDIDTRIHKLLTDRSYFNMQLRNMRKCSRIFTTKQAKKLMQKVFDALGIV